MTEPSDLDDRLARLAARKARAARPDSAVTNTAGEPAPPKPAKRARRKHPAAAARILSLGLSSSAFFSMLAAFGESAPAPVARRAQPVPTITRPVTARPRTKVIVKYVHHTVLVDRAGRPITSGAAAISTGNRPTAGATPARWTAPAAGNPPAAAAPGAAPAAPTQPNQGTPAPVTATPAPAPAPAPAPTPPPPTVVTTPPPPPPPACSGTKCP